VRVCVCVFYRLALLVSLKDYAFRKFSYIKVANLFMKLFFFKFVTVLSIL